MMIKNSKFCTWFVIFICSVIYNFYLLKSQVGVYDEGIVLAGADRILKGQVPYKDFWSMYPPGQYYTLAMLFKLFGTSILTERVYDLIIRSLLPSLIFLIIILLGLSSFIAILGWGMVLVVLGSLEFASYPVYPAILLLLLGAYFFLLDLQFNKSHYLVLSGFFIAVGSMFRHDLAGYTAISLWCTLVFKNFIVYKKFLHRIGYVVVGLLLAGVPVIIWLLTNVELHVIFDQLLFTPTDIMPKYRWLPYPKAFSLSVIHFYVYPFVLFLAFGASWYRIVKLKVYDSLSFYVFFLSLTGIFFINQARVRSDSIHLLPTVIIAIVTGLAMFSMIIVSKRKLLKSKLHVIAAYILLVFLLIPLISPLYSKIKSLNYNYFTVSESFYRCGYARINDDLNELISYIRNSTSDNEAIYVGVENHDKFIISDVAIYFLANRQYPTKYHELHPGVTNKPDIQNEIIRDLRNASVKLIVLRPRYKYEPNYTAIDLNVNYLDDYIRQCYEMTVKIGEYEVWKLKT